VRWQWELIQIIKVVMRFKLNWEMAEFPVSMIPLKETDDESNSIDGSENKTITNYALFS
jgi:hypothetical protein